ncbi:MAG: hypothetical protein ACE366_10730 [Bradymonadia bacterium]
MSDSNTAVHHVPFSRLTLFGVLCTFGALASPVSAAPALCIEGFDTNAPHLEQRQQVVSHDVAPEGLTLSEGWTPQWQSVSALCGISWADTCTPREQLITAITDVSSSDPTEKVSGRPGVFTSDRILVDDDGFIVDLNAAHGARTYTFTITALDASGNRAETTCDVHLESLVLHSATPTAGGLQVVYSKSFDACVTVEHGMSGPRGPALCASGERVTALVSLPGEGAVKLCHQGDRRACSAEVPRAPTMALALPRQP